MLHNQPPVLCRFLVPILVLTGCVDDEGPDSVLTTDSAGAVIVEHSADPTPPSESILHAPSLVIGSESDPLHRVVATMRLADGGIVVANAGELEVRIYNGDGSLRTSIGRQGRGPGEFESIFDAFLMPGDSIAVFDTQRQRMTIFSPTGEVTRTFTMSQAPELGRGVPLGLLPGGNWLMAFSDRIGPWLPQGVKNLPLYLYEYSSSGEALRRLTSSPGNQVFIHHVNGSVVVPPVPLGRRATAVAAHSGFIVAASDRYEIRFYRSDGQLERIVRRPVDGGSVSDVAIEAAEARLLERIPPPMQDPIREAFQLMPKANSYPVLGTPDVIDRSPWIVLAPDDGIWVRRYNQPDEPTIIWDSFDSAGVFQREVHLDNNISLYEVGGDYVLGVRTNATGAEHVVLMRRRRDTAPKSRRREPLSVDTPRAHFDLSRLDP